MTTYELMFNDTSLNLPKTVKHNMPNSPDAFPELQAIVAGTDFWLDIMTDQVDICRQADPDDNDDDRDAGYVQVACYMP